ncbi:DUF2627 domain-containing protein [Chryseomicrobium sp. FSL W7-1435]|uniref:DUF2627 domain-containing protein n=1 Tax=Chryseomicrobium sp. FSL W7-1435 TaxID=2921704 RepID=UPI00315A7C34
MARLVALIILVIPGIFAAYGIKLMRDTFFGVSNLGTAPLWLQFILGLLFMIMGVGFFAGFLLRRDRKNGRVSERFKEKKG